MRELRRTDALHVRRFRGRGTETRVSPSTRLSLRAFFDGDMKRRALLTSIAASGGVAGTAGCLQSLGSPAGTATDDAGTTTSGDGEPGTGSDRTTDQNDRRTTDDETTDEGGTTDGDETTDGETTDDDETTDQDGEWNPTGEPVATRSINERDGLSFPDNNQPHSLALWNAVDREREMRVEWGDGRTEELERLDAITVPADGLLQVDLLLPTNYDVIVRVDGERLGEYAVDRGQFDCNQSASRLGLTEGDAVDHGIVSTAAGCPAPSVADTTLSAGEGDCGTEDAERADAAYGEAVVRVDGTFVAPDPCHDLAVADVTYDGKRRTARIVVAATPGDACVQCVGAIDYEATVAYEHDFPDRVVVVHRSGDHERRVAAATWNADA
jgi:hypothetical protein